MQNRILAKTNNEALFGSCSAMQIGHRIFISGLTGDPQKTLDAQFGEIIEQVDRLLSSLGSSRSDVVRTAVYYSVSSDRPEIRALCGKHLGSRLMAMSLTQMAFLPSSARLAIDLEAVRESHDTRTILPLDNPEARQIGCAGLVRVGDNFWFSGMTAICPDGTVIGAGSKSEQETEIVTRMVTMLEAIGSKPQDILRVRFFTPVYYLSANGTPNVSPAHLTLMHPGHPGSAGITVSGLGAREVGLLVEGEGIRGAAKTRNNVWDGRTALEERHYSRSVGVGDVVYVSGSTSLVPGEIVRSPFDAYGQTLNTLETVRWSIEQQGLSWADLVRIRCYVVGEENMEVVARGLREVIGRIQPAVTILGVPALGQPTVLEEIEATAVRGAADCT